jgi:hypothetical protein
MQLIIGRYGCVATRRSGTTSQRLAANILGRLLGFSGDGLARGAYLLQEIQRALHPSAATVQDIGVDHRRLHASMTQQLPRGAVQAEMRGFLALPDAILVVTMPAKFR